MGLKTRHLTHKRKKKHNLVILNELLLLESVWEVIDSDNESLLLLVSIRQVWFGPFWAPCFQLSHDWVTGQAGNTTCIVTVTSHQDIPLLSPVFTPTSEAEKKKTDGLGEDTTKCTFIHLFLN